MENESDSVIFSILIFLNHPITCVDIYFYLGSNIYLSVCVQLEEVLEFFYFNNFYKYNRKQTI